MRFENVAGNSAVWLMVIAILTLSLAAVLAMRIAYGRYMKAVDAGKRSKSFLMEAVSVAISILMLVFGGGALLFAAYGPGTPVEMVAPEDEGVNASMENVVPPITDEALEAKRDNEMESVLKEIEIIINTDASVDDEIGKAVKRALKLRNSK